MIQNYETFENITVSGIIKFFTEKTRG